jgi:hypothetical protein
MLYIGYLSYPSVMSIMMYIPIFACQALMPYGSYSLDKPLATWATQSCDKLCRATIRSHDLRIIFIAARYSLARPLSKLVNRCTYLSFVTKLHKITLWYFAHLFVYVLLLSAQYWNDRYHILFMQWHNICTHHIRV